MGKKKHDKKALSKKARRLAEREAEIAAILAEREAKAKAAKKRKAAKAEPPAKVGKTKKAKAPKKGDRPAEVIEITAEAEAHIAPAAEIQSADDAAERAKPLKGKALKAALEADTTAAAERMAETDAEIKARVQAKRAARAAAAAGEPGSAERLAAMQENVKAAREERTPAPIVEVETEQGRVFEAGESTPAETTVIEEEFGKPSEAGGETGPTLEEGRNGYKIIQLDADGKPDPRKVRQLTRVTTFVGNIDDESMLRAWERRLLAEGLSAAADEFAPRVNDLAHRYSVTVTKARKADRKGKLGLGELARIEAKASKDYKDALNTIVDEALEAAGRNEKADAGTNLHALAELADAEGIDAVRAKHEAEEISETDVASIEAYVERMRRLNAKVIESEAVIVNDAMGYAGRLDRILMAKLPALKIQTADGVIERPADQRARRYVADIKSGRIDLGAGKIARQLAAYALGDLYDLETGERSRHSAARDIALVFHLPQGAGVCTVHAVDIKHGAVLLRLSADVRRARNSGKKTIDTSVDITDAEPGE